MKYAQLVIFVVCLGAAAGFLGAGGVADMWGVNPETSQVEKAGDQLDSEFSVFQSQTTQETWLTDVFIIRAVLNTASGIYDVISAFPDMLKQLGLPGWVVDFITAPILVLFIFFFFYMAIGRDPTR